MCVSSGGRFSSTLSSETIITDGDWHRIGFTWDGSIRRLYVDDVLVDEKDAEGEYNIWTFADDRGDLVVKCNIDIVKGMVTVDEEATFVLEVDTDDGPYSGTDTIAVIDRGK